MGRPPCFDKIGVKKGPWTPEEDIILVSYIQEHGPGNWRSVPTNTGLMRCSKSCRLRWTNYLRPGIKRGNFTPQEEGMIIHLQTLLGNKWAAIASYLPQRTDNDIKNYWNTHLKKKLKKYPTAMDGSYMATSNSSSSTHNQLIPKIFNTGIKSTSDANTSINTTNPSPNQSSSTYVSSTENISRLLEGWIRPSPNANLNLPQENHQDCHKTSRSRSGDCDDGLVFQVKPDQERSHGPIHDPYMMLSFDNMNGAAIAWNDKSSTDSMIQGSQSTVTDFETKRRVESSQPSFTLLEKWILDDTSTEKVEELMEISANCCSNLMF